jgi:hypothetical protein
MEARRGVKPTTGEVGRGSVRAGAFRVALPRGRRPLDDSSVRRFHGWFFQGIRVMVSPVCAVHV